TNPREMRFAQVALRFVVTDLGVTLAYLPGVRAQQRLKTLTALWWQFVIPDPSGVYLPVVLERPQKQFRREVIPNRRLAPLVRGKCPHERVALFLLGGKDTCTFIFTEPRQHGLG